MARSRQQGAAESEDESDGPPTDDEGSRPRPWHAASCAAASWSGAASSSCFLAGETMPDGGESVLDAGETLYDPPL